MTVTYECSFDSEGLLELYETQFDISGMVTPPLTDDQIVDLVKAYPAWHFVSDFRTVAVPKVVVSR